MIRKIGVIAQDAISIGFLRGLCARLECQAELIDPPAPLGTTQSIPRKNAKQASIYFHSKGADLIVRFTDADSNSWQRIRQEELQAFPIEDESLLVCGVAEENVEDWLGLDPQYLSTALGIPVNDLLDGATRSGRIKTAIRESRQGDEELSETVTRLVSQLPKGVFRKWIRNSPSLSTFYAECRAAAQRADCVTPNEADMSHSDG